MTKIARNHILNSKERLLCHFENIIGDGDEFTLDHRFFNCICLIVGISYIFRILINIFLGIKLLQLTLSHVISFFCILSIYYLSRYSGKMNLSKFLFFILLLVTFSGNWYFTGGTMGVMLFYYFWLFTIVFLIFKGQYKILAISIILINVSIMIYIEYRYPQLMIQRIDAHKLSLYKYMHFLFVMILTALIFQIVNLISSVDKLSSIVIHHKDLVLNDFNVQKSEIIYNLTIQERKILYLILDGKKNKEIADMLFIDICTVKTHINNIYKKIGIHKRSGLLSRIIR